MKKGPAKKTKDLPAKSPGGVKGGQCGKLVANDNITLVRAARKTL